MASRHDIVSITFQANAGKANVALQALQAESKKSSDRVKELKTQLEQGLRANLPTDQIEKIRVDIKAAEKEVKQWNSAYNELTKGVRTLDEAVKQFNAGTMGQMSAAFNKAAANAAKLAQTKMTPGTQEWKEMDALIVEAQSNVLKANTAINDLTATIKNGGAVSKSTLTQAKTDLEQLLTLEVRGSAEWNTYDKQLKMVQGELTKLAEAERKVAQADQTAVMTKRMKDLKSLSSEALSETKKYWETMVAGAENGSAEMAKYEANLKKVVNQERQRKAASAEQVLTNMSGSGIEQVRQATQDMEKLRDSVVKGSRDWLHWNKMVNEGNAYLAKFDEEAKIARGDAMRINDALKLASTAGGKGFQGTATQLQQAEAALQKMSATLKKGSPDWYKYQEALAKVRVEMQNTGMTSERMQAILDKPTNAKNLNELQAAVKRAKAELDLMAGTVGKNSTAYTQLADKTKQAEVQLKALQAQSHGTASAFDKAWSRLKTYVGLYVGAAMAMQKIAATMGDLMELSDKMGEVRKTTGWSADEVGRLSDNLKKLDVRTSLVGLLDLSAAAGQLGLKTQEAVEGFTKSANMLTIALPEMGREAATSLVKIADATGDLEKNGGDIEETLQRVGSTIIALRANSASAAPQITDFVKRVGAVGAQAGISIDQIAALGSTIDALGGRVEMSATALSRMIPAIRNNAFGVANAIGVAEKELTDLFNQGKAMEAMVLIFRKMSESVKRFDTSTEEGMEAMANDVEALMGKNAAMADVMKELNQQGARAGIVFGLLSQNVDKLEDQLKIAGDAYRDNTALLNEFNNMNETTAAKWARLKNEIEEMFVSDNAQRWLGGIIDAFRKLVVWIADDGPIAKGFKVITTYVVAFRMGLGSVVLGAGTALKNLGTAIMAVANVAGMALGKVGTSLGLVTARTRLARMEWAKMDAAMKANVWGAAIAAIGMIAWKLWDVHKAAKEAAAEVGRFNQKLSDEKKALDDLFTPLNKSNIAQDERSKLITEINSKYSKYLGYMVSETTSAIQLAEAHALIAKRVREEAYEKRILQQEDAVRNQHEEKMSERYGSLEGAVRRNAQNGTDIGGVADALKNYIDRNLGTIENDFYMGSLRESNESVQKFMSSFERYLERLAVDGKISRDGFKDIKGVAFQYLNEAKKQAVDLEKATANSRADLRNVQREIGGDINANLNRLVGNLANFSKRTPEQGVPATIAKPEEEQVGLRPITIQQPNHDWRGNAGTQANIETPLPSWEPNVNKKDIESVKQYVEAQDQLRSFLQANAGRIDEQTRKTAEMYLESEESLNELRKLLPAVSTGGTGGGGTGGDNPYGTFNRVTSPYEEWDADSLVARRKEMLERVRTLANGADVQKVMSEDAKFISEAVRNNIKTTKQAIEWYNAERLKIQEALHEKHLTNSGDWMDPKKSGRKPRQVESDYALAELDRYYSRRKEELEKARAEENMSEELFNRQAELLEQEHLERRSKLRETFTAGASEQEKQMVKDFRAWWAKLAETGDLDEVPWATVESEWSKALESQRGLNNLRAQQDMTKLEQITVKHLNAIAKIIDRERPYDGITANLRDNLTKMDILFADLDKQGATDAATLVSEQSKRLSFLLEEAGHAYALTFEQLNKDMREKGFGAWADELGISEDKKQQILSQLRTAYDAIQEAIKKEASTIKKQTDVLWKDAMPGSQSVKQQYEMAISALGLEQNRVTQANGYVADAGQASERVVDRLAIKQMQVQLAMQEHYYNMMRKVGLERIKQQQDAARGYANEAKSLKAQAEQLRAQGKEQQAITAERQAQVALQKSLSAEQDAKNIATSLEVSMTEELKKKEEQRLAIANKVAESQKRLYDEMKEWADLLSTSMKNVFEATNAGNADYYNERARIALEGESKDDNGNLERKQYVVIENEGTSGAEAHYETLSELEYLNRQHEIEQDAATKDAWRQVMDDFNEKLGKSITDYFNAMQQQAVVDRNTEATTQNTEKLGEESDALAEANEATGQGIKAANVNTDATQANTNALLQLTAAILGQKFQGQGGKGESDSGGGLSGRVGGPTPEAGDAEAVAATVEVGPLEAVGVENPATKNQWVVTEEQADATIANVGHIWDTVGQKAVDANVAVTEAYNEGTQGMRQPPVTTNKVSEEDAEVTATSVDTVGSRLVETNINAVEQIAEDTTGLPAVPVTTNTVTPEQAEVSANSISTLGEEMVKVNTDVIQEVSDNTQGLTVPPVTTTPASEESVAQVVDQHDKVAQEQINNDNKVTAAAVANDKKRENSAKSSNKVIEASTSKTFGQMVASVNWYGAAYAAMSNDNMTWSQKFASFTLQTFGQMLIQMLTTKISETTGQAAADTPLILSKCIKALGPIGGPAAFAGLMSVIGGLMGVAASAISGSKSEIAQATGASNSGATTTHKVNVGRISTGMLTYAEGNVNEFTDPGTLTEGRMYNVDAADGKTYRAKYTGRNPRTHITSGPEFHLAGEAGPEAIIDADTTRQIRFDESGIWRAIKTLSGGGSLSYSTRHKGGVRAFAEGNLDEVDSGQLTDDSFGGVGADQLTALQASIDRQSDLLEYLRDNGIKASFDTYGKYGLVDTYDTAKKTLERYGERY